MGVFALGLTILFTALIGWGLVKRRQYKKTAVPYIRQVFPEMVQWNPLGAKRHMAPQALVGTTDAEFEKLFAWFSRLGKLKNFEEPKFLNVTAGATLNLVHTKLCVIKS